MIRVIIPYHLKMLAKISGEVELDVAPPVTLRSALDALEARYPMLRGTIRDQVYRRAPGVLAVLRLRTRLFERTGRRTAAGGESHRAASRCWSSARLPAGRQCNGGFQPPMDDDRLRGIRNYGG